MACIRIQNHQQELHGCQDKRKGKVYPTSNVVTKAWIKDIYLPILLVMSSATLIDNREEKEYLDLTFEMMIHGVTVHFNPINLGGEEGLFI